MAEFVMPALGADMKAGTLVAWRRQPGERVSRGDIIADVETEKGIIEVEVFTAGVIERFLVEPGTTVPVGTALAVIREEGAGAETTKEPAPEPPALHEATTPRSAEGATTTAAQPRAGDAPSHRGHTAYGGFVPRGEDVPATPSARRYARERGMSLGAAVPGRTVRREDLEREREGQARVGASARAEESSPRLRISPVARRRARELGVDPARVTPSVDGVVHLADVERSAPTPTRASPAEAPESPASGMRRAIAAAMARSKREIPHYYLSTTFDLGPATVWLEAENASRPVTERLLPGVLLLKAAALALREVPELNAHWTGEAAPPLDAIHLGVAISLRGGGLIAPALHDADRMELVRLMGAFRDLVKRARTGRIRSSEMADATITVTSLGDRGVETVLPIINPPQVAMVGFGRVVRRPWVVGEHVEPRPVVTATLAGDHRVTDGHRGGLYLAAIERLLQQPEDL